MTDFNEEDAHNPPCDPDDGCEECSEYWNRMVEEGLWDQQKHCWTNKGWKEVLK